MGAQIPVQLNRRTKTAHLHQQEAEMKIVFYWGGMALAAISLFAAISQFYSGQALAGIGCATVFVISVFSVKKGL
jgi:hypothetical protein